MGHETANPRDWVNKVIEEAHQEIQLAPINTSLQALQDYDLKQAARHRRLYQVPSDLEQAASPVILAYLPKLDIKGHDRLKFLYYQLGLELHQFKPQAEAGSKPDQDMTIVQAFHDKLAAVAEAYGIVLEPLSEPKRSPRANELGT